MKGRETMKPTTPHTRRHMLALGLAALGGAAIAQEAPPAPPTPPASGASRPGRAKHLHSGKLKEQLKLTEAQEGAWKQFVDAMHPPALRSRQTRQARQTRFARTPITNKTPAPQHTSRRARRLFHVFRQHTTQSNAWLPAMFAGGVVILLHLCSTPPRAAGLLRRLPCLARSRCLP